MRAALALLLAPLSITLAVQQPAFRTTTQTVMVYATVRDEAGRLVPDLPQDAFEILDNGNLVPITTFSSEIQPLTVALLLDMSGSMNPRLLRVRDSTLHFIEALRSDDRVRIGTFGSEIALSPILTGDKTTLTRVVHEELWPGGGTPLWNAVYAGMDSLSKEGGRRVILVLTDGMDSGDSLPGWKGTLGDVRRRATREGFMFYMIGMEALEASLTPKPDVVALIDETGGGRFNVTDEEDLGQTFSRVADELRRQYLIGFSPETFDGREHRLELRVARPGLQARGRKSYVAIRQ